MATASGSAAGCKAGTALADVALEAAALGFLGGAAAAAVGAALSLSEWPQLSEFTAAAIAAAAAPAALRATANGSNSGTPSSTSKAAAVVASASADAGVALSAAPPSLLLRRFAAGSMPDAAHSASYLCLSAAANSLYGALSASSSTFHCALILPAMADASSPGCAAVSLRRSASV